MESGNPYWRARRGYTTAPTPEPEPTPVPQPQPIMFSHNYYVVVPQQQPLAYAAPIYQAAPPAPASTSSKKSTSSSKKGDGPLVTPPPAPAATAAPAPTNPNEPPQMRPGMNYMLPKQHTKLHVFNKSSKIWEDKYKGKSFNFKIFNVATTFTPAMVIENVTGKSDPKGWAITEVMETGNGEWKKGTTIEHGGDRAGASLASMGWSGKRGDVLPPVWVVVHKV